jgi:hypothetical protein
MRARVSFYLYEKVILTIGPESGWPKIVSGPCWATVPRSRPRPGPTIGLGQPEALSPSCRVVLGSGFSGRARAGPSGLAHLAIYTTAATRGDCQMGPPRTPRAAAFVRPIFCPRSQPNPRILTNSGLKKQSLYIFLEIPELFILGIHFVSIYSVPLKF